MFFQTFLVVVIANTALSQRILLSTGEIEGKTLNATYSPLGNQSAIVFLGIPYVAPPLGNLRFHKPKPPIPWKGILETKAYRPACMSNATKTYKNSVGGPISEDCLYANVFTNEYCLEKKNCSVMIAIHGGGFLFESASAFNPEILINNFVGQNRNIVVVSLNYRLGAFGFGHLAGDVGERNLGLFDILAGVKWVRQEIHSFGGNKHRITLMGHSAGAGLVALFSISPLTKGLIHQQIVMSGPLTNLSKKSNYKAMTKVTQIVGCLPEDVGFEPLSKVQLKKVSVKSIKKEAVILIAYSCLRSKSAQEILDAEMFVMRDTTYYFGAPHVDGEFIIDYPDHIFQDKSVFPINTMLGTTTAELRDSIYINDPKNADKKEELLQNMCEHIGFEIYKEPERFVDQCVKNYGNATQAQYLSDDMEFYSRAISTANLHLSENTKVYLYSYAYSGAGRAFNKYLNVPSPHHSEDLIYVFGTHRGVFAPKDYIIEQIYTGMFANFINFGNPTLSEDQPWLQYTKEKREHFVINFDANFTMPGMRELYYTNAMNFWHNAGEKTFREHFSKSLDTFHIVNLNTPIVSHIDGISTDVDKTFEQTEILFSEREQFLAELKLKRNIGKVAGNGWGREAAARIVQREAELEENGGGINILLIIFAGTLVFGILYVTISHFCLHHRSREGYQLLK
ncbi:Protein CBG04745 [Caenorhabditis briggsae]|uniref:Carboxylic ester hydrolase n=1 Tax=Caenorhabditis briggsae TaxID=6238 RepID=A8WYD4_CAEBR|nr:Protein CBG04745 [Caenorhabditis briggsae]CAP25392.2 Protein CBG04745 [Caenorhabditis briggsae]